MSTIALYCCRLQYFILSTAADSPGCTKVCSGNRYCYTVHMTFFSGSFCTCQSGYQMSDSGCKGEIFTDIILNCCAVDKCDRDGGGSSVGGVGGCVGGGGGVGINS